MIKIVVQVLSGILVALPQSRSQSLNRTDLALYVRTSFNVDATFELENRQ